MELIAGLLLLSLGIIYGQNDDPIVNDQPDVVPPSDENDSWFEHKYIAATLDKHFAIIMGIIGILFFALTLCIIFKCRKRNRNGEYSRQRFNAESDYDTDVDIEKQPFNYK